MRDFPHTGGGSFFVAVRKEAADIRNYNVKVGFAEPRSDGRSNAMIANVLEYGKSGQPAKPFLKPARTASRAPCIEAMKRTFEQEVEKI